MKGCHCCTSVASAAGGDFFGPCCPHPILQFTCPVVISSTTCCFGLMVPSRTACSLFTACIVSFEWQQLWRPVVRSSVGWGESVFIYTHNSPWLCGQSRKRGQVAEAASQGSLQRAGAATTSPSTTCFASQWWHPLSALSLGWQFRPPGPLWRSVHIATAKLYVYVEKDSPCPPLHCFTVAAFETIQYRRQTSM